MKRWIKGSAVVLAALAGLAAVAVFAGLQLAERKRNRVIQLEVAPVAFTTDAQALERGKYLFLSRGCVDCHGAAGTGRTFVNDGKGTHIAGPNITPLGVTARYMPADWVRIIRHGIKLDGRPALVMPSEDYNRFTDEDLTALVSYIRTLAPAKGPEAVIELPLPAWVLYGFGAIPDAASRIDHSLPPSKPVPAAVDAKHGAYVANMCIGCHGEKLSGGKIPGGPPDWPAASNLTPGEGSAMARYPDAQAFMAMLKTGKRPDGTAIQVMPFESLSKMNEVDAAALHAFLKTVPPVKAGNR